MRRWTNQVVPEDVYADERREALVRTNLQLYLDRKGRQECHPSLVTGDYPPSQ